MRECGVEVQHRVVVEVFILAPFQAEERGKSLAEKNAHVYRLVSALSKMHHSSRGAVHGGHAKVRTGEAAVDREVESSRLRLHSEVYVGMRSVLYHATQTLVSPQMLWA